MAFLVNDIAKYLKINVKPLSGARPKKSLPITVRNPLRHLAKTHTEYGLEVNLKNA
jgi:hypothetical protein